MEEVWKNIRVVIKEQGLKQFMVAQRMGVTRQSFSAMQHYSPSVRSLERIAAALNVQVRDFFVNCQEAEPSEQRQSTIRG